jgi:LacI family transcriptional regulator
MGEYLWELGHRRVVLLAAGAYPRVANRRYFGLHGVWTEQGGDVSLIQPVQYDKAANMTEREQVRKAVLNLFGPESTVKDRATAVVCASEHVAAVAAQTLAELGLRVPADVSLAAFGDTPRVAEDMIPALTTVAEPVALLADAALTQLTLLHDDQMPDDPAQHDLSFPGELIIRASCAVPANS